MGLSFLDTNGDRVTTAGNDGVRLIDFSKAIPDAPIHRGFDQFFGTACCPTTDWLYAYIDGDRIPVPPSMTEIRDRAQLPDHPYSRDCRGGLIAPDFDLEEVDLVFLEKSQQFLRNHLRENPDEPFFLFHSMQAVHLPSFPAAQFKGKSGAGPHGDFIFEMDWIVGELMRTLEELGATEDTLVIFCSDNGPEVGTTFHMRQDHDHDGANPWRGVKRDAWEGGHRTPFIARWPGKIAQNVTNDELLSLTDIFATCASIVGYDLPTSAGEDSFDMLPVFLGQKLEAPIRPILLQQTFSQTHLSIRQGNWKYLDHKGSGGNNYEKREEIRTWNIPDTAPDIRGQLYNLAEDPGETINLVSTNAEKAAALKALLDEAVASGRTAPLR